MIYALVVLTHGDTFYLEQALASFEQMVRPAPTRTVIVRDEEGQGFCKSTKRAWDAGVEAGTPYVFHLEHDFLFRREVSLYSIADALNRNKRLAQIAFVRQAVNKEERDAGGNVAKHKARGVIYTEHEGWIEHSSHFTTNPSLMTREFMASNPFPDCPDCEGLFGIDLRERGYSFGLWGWGESWVEHIGIRTGVGY